MRKVLVLAMIWAQFASANGVHQGHGGGDIGALPHGGDVGNGGGTAEQNIMYAYENLQSFAGQCYHQYTLCQLDEDQSEKLGRIVAAIPKEQEVKDQIQFKSEKEEPGFFIIDGAERVAVTGSTVGSTIYINRDLIYMPGENGEIVAMDIPTAVAMLVHEMGHHVGLSGDLVLLDLIGAKVKSMMMAMSQSISIQAPAQFQYFKASTVLLSDPVYLSKTEVLFDDEYWNVINVTNLIREKINQAQICRRIHGFNENGRTDFLLENIHWPRNRDVEFDKSHRGIKLHGQLRAICPLRNGSRGWLFLDDFDLEIIIPFNNEVLGAMLLKIETDLTPKINLIDCAKNHGRACN